MMRTALFLCTAGAVMLVGADASANKVTTLNVSAPNGWDDAPLLVVYSDNGERYTDIDPVHTTRVRVNLGARCRFEGRGNKAYRGELNMAGFTRVGTKEPANFLIPHSSEASALFRWDGPGNQPFDAVKACNAELDKRVATSGKTKYEIMADGFTFKYPAALRATYNFRCEATGLGRTDLESKSANVNTRVQCLASPAAAKKIPDAKPKPKRAPIVPARQKPLLKSASFEAVPEVYTADCPATIEFKGTLTANRAGTVEYRYTKYDGTASPVYKLEFDGPGTRATREWRTTYRPPNAATTLSAGTSDQPQDFQGWYRLDVLSPNPGGQIAAHYRVMCGADSAATPEQRIQAVPATRAPVAIKPARQKEETVVAPTLRKAVPPKKDDN